MMPAHSRASFLAHGMRLAAVGRGVRAWLHDGVLLAERIGLPTACLLCNAAAGATPNLCRACEAELPWIRPALAKLACPRCAEPGVDGATCGRCLRSPPPFSRSHAAFAYSWPIDHLVSRMKYRDCPAAARTLATLLARSLTDVRRVASRRRAPAHDDPPLLVPVPLHRARMVERGYNQCVRLASVLARQLDVECATDAMARQRDTPAQATLAGIAERAGNVSRAFVVRQPTRVSGRRVVLLDDVVTSTSTVRAAGAALLDAGVSSVEVWTVARAARAR